MARKYLGLELTDGEPLCSVQCSPSCTVGGSQPYGFNNPKTHQVSALASFPMERHMEQITPHPEFPGALIKRRFLAATWDFDLL